MNQELIAQSSEIEARLRTGATGTGVSYIDDIRDEGAETIAALRTALEESQDKASGFFTADEQQILSTSVDSLRLLALWNHIQSGKIELEDESAFYEDRSCQLYDLAKNLVSRKKKD